MLYRHQDDRYMIEIMHAMEIEDWSIRHMADLRVRNERNPLEITDEWRRLDFYRRLADSGRIGRDDHAPSLTKLHDLQHWIDWAGASSQRRPNVAG